MSNVVKSLGLERSTRAMDEPGRALAKADRAVDEAKRLLTVATLNVKMAEQIRSDLKALLQAEKAAEALYAAKDTPTTE